MTQLIGRGALRARGGEAPFPVGFEPTPSGLRYLASIQTDLGTNLKITAMRLGSKLAVKIREREGAFSEG